MDTAKTGHKRSGKTMWLAVAHVVLTSFIVHQVNAEYDCPSGLLQFRDRCLLMLYDVNHTQLDTLCGDEDSQLQPLAEPDLHLYTFLRGLIAEFVQQNIQEARYYIMMALRVDQNSSGGFSWYNGQPATLISWEDNEPVTNYTHGFVPVLHQDHYFRLKTLPPEEAQRTHMFVCELRLHKNAVNGCLPFWFAVHSFPLYGGRFRHSSAPPHMFQCLLLCQNVKLGMCHAALYDGPNNNCYMLDHREGELRRFSLGDDYVASNSRFQYFCNECDTDLSGNESWVPDALWTSSPHMPDRAAHSARMQSDQLDAPPWEASNTMPWIQVEFPEIVSVTVLMVEYAAVGDIPYRYKLNRDKRRIFLYGSTNLLREWEEVDEGVTVMFDMSNGLFGGRGVRYLVPLKLLLTRVIRLQATDSRWAQHSHRLGIRGCVAKDQNVDVETVPPAAMGIASRAIPDSAIWAQDYELDHPAWTGRLQAENKTLGLGFSTYFQTRQEQSVFRILLHKTYFITFIMVEVPDSGNLLYSLDIMCVDYRLTHVGIFRVGSTTTLINASYVMRDNVAHNIQLRGPPRLRVEIFGFAAASEQVLTYYPQSTPVVKGQYSLTEVNSMIYIYSLDTQQLNNSIEFHFNMSQVSFIEGKRCSRDSGNPMYDVPYKFDVYYTTDGLDAITVNWTRIPYIPNEGPFLVVHKHPQGLGLHVAGPPMFVRGLKLVNSQEQCFSDPKVNIYITVDEVNDCPRGFIEHGEWCYWITWQLKHRLTLKEYQERCWAIGLAETRAHLVVLPSLSELAFWRYMWHMLPVPVPLGLHPDPESPAGGPWSWQWEGDVNSTWVRWDEANGWPTDIGDLHNVVGSLGPSNSLAVQHRGWDEEWDNKPIACQMRKPTALSSQSCHWLFLHGREFLTSNLGYDVSFLNTTLLECLDVVETRDDIYVNYRHYGVQFRQYPNHTYCIIASHSRFETIPIEDPSLGFETDPTTVVAYRHCHECKQELVWSDMYNRTLVSHPGSDHQPLGHANWRSMGIAHWEADFTGDNYIQVEFKGVLNISVLQTYAPATCYVSEFEFLYSLYGQLWAVANEAVTAKAMSLRHGDFDEVRDFLFEPMLTGAYFRIAVRAVVVRACLRFELYGCPEKPPGCPVELKSWGTGDNNYTGRVQVKGVLHFLSIPASHLAVVTIVASNHNLQCLDPRVDMFDVNSPEGAQNFVSYVLGLPTGTVLVGASGGDVSAQASIMETAFVELGMDVWKLESSSSLTFYAMAGHQSFALQRVGLGGMGPNILYTDLSRTQSDFYNSPLGMETGDWQSSQIVVSSSAPHFPVNHIRLWSLPDEFGGGVWQPAMDDYKSSSILVDYGFTSYDIHSLQVQGGGPYHDCYVKTMKVEAYQHSMWAPWEAAYGDQGVYRVLESENQGATIYLSSKGQQERIRLSPLSWHGAPCMKLELTGSPSYTTLQLTSAGRVTPSVSPELVLKDIYVDTKIIYFYLNQPVQVLPRPTSWIQVVFQQFVPIVGVQLTLPTPEAANLTLWTTMDGTNFTSAMRRVYYNCLGEANCLSLNPPTPVKGVRVYMDFVGPGTISVVFNASGPSSPCPVGMVRMGRECYGTLQSMGDWNRNKRTCEDEWGARLASVLDPGIRRTMANIMKLQRMELARVELYGNGSVWRGVDGSELLPEGAAWESGSGETPDSCVVLVADTGLFRSDSCENLQVPLCVLYVGGDTEGSPIWKYRIGYAITGQGVTTSEDLVTSPADCIAKCINNCIGVTYRYPSACDVIKRSQQHADKPLVYTPLSDGSIMDLTPYLTCGHPLLSSWPHLINVKTSSGSVPEIAHLQIDGASAWHIPHGTPNREWIEFSLMEFFNVSYLVSQGSVEHDCWVSSWMILYNDGGPAWTTFRDSTSQPLIFPTNWSPSLPATLPLPGGLVLRSMRLLMTGLVNGLALRLEVYGCWVNHTSTFLAGYRLGLESDAIADWQLRAAQNPAPNLTSLEAAFKLNTDLSASHPSLAPSWRQGSSSGNWLEVDLLGVYHIQGLIVQGDGMEDAWSSQLQIEYSLLGAVPQGQQAYKQYPHTLTGLGGAVNPTVEIYVAFSTPIEARYIKCKTLSSVNFPAIRVELFGQITETNYISREINEVSVDITASSGLGNCNHDLTSLAEGSSPCGFWCPTAMPIHWLHVEYKRFWRFSSIILNITETDAWHKITGTTIETFISTTPRPLKIAETLYLENKAVQYNLHPARGHALKLTFTGEQFGCVTLHTYATLVSACPTGYAHYGFRCYRPYRASVLRAAAVVICDRAGSQWLSKPGQLAKVDTPEKRQFVERLTNGFDNALWIGGGKHADSDVWTWDDDSVITWVQWAPDALEDLPGPRYMLLEPNNGNVTSQAPENGTAYFLCEVEIAEYASTGLSGLWTKRAVYLTSPVLFETALSSPAHCMSLCQHLTTCRSAEITNGFCRIRSTNRYTEQSQYGSTDIYEYFLVDDSCNKPLFRGYIGYSVNASSVYMNFSAENVPYGTLYTDRNHWRPYPDLTEAILTLNFIDIATITRIMTKGMASLSGGPGDGRPGSYDITFTEDYLQWLDVSNSDMSTTSLAGMFDASDSVTEPYDNLLFSRPSGRGFIFTFYKETSSIPIALEMELYGCIISVPPNCYQDPKEVEVEVGTLSATIPLICIDTWTVFLRRGMSGAPFARDWPAYKNTFGEDNPDSYYWLGVEVISYLTQLTPMVLRIDVWAGDFFYSAEYGGMVVMGEGDGYQLEIHEFYGGSAGSSNLLDGHHATNFTVRDTSDGNCNVGGWWLRPDSSSCQYMHLTCADGAAIWDWSFGGENPPNEPIKKVLARLRPMHAGLVNVARGKPSFQSSTWKDAVASRALDGWALADITLDSCARTLVEDDPWWLVNLETIYQVTSVQLQDAAGCCQELSDVKVYVGQMMASSASAFTEAYVLCRQFAGPVADGRMATVTCSNPVRGKYMAIVTSGPAKELTLCEVIVFTENAIGFAGLGDYCGWNADCQGVFVECRPEPMSEIFRCGCLNYYVIIEGICIPESDLHVSIINTTLPGAGIVREYYDDIFLEVEISHLEGASVYINQGETGFNVTSFMGWMSPGNITLVPVHDHVNWTVTQFGRFSVDDTLNMSIQASLTVPMSQCHLVSSLCFTITPAPLFYVELDTITNMACFNISVVCRPDIDMKVEFLNYIGAQSLVRNTRDLYPFQVGIRNKGSSLYDVVSLESGYSNYEFFYFYDSVNQTNGSYRWNMPMSLGQLDVRETSVGLRSSAAAWIGVNISQGMDFESCAETSYLCVWMRDASEASFKEADMQDNVFCTDITQVKECKPEISLDLDDLTVVPIEPIVRGYPADTGLAFNIANVHPSYAVMPPIHNGTNFNYTVYLDRDTTILDNLTHFASGPSLAICNATDAVLAPNASVVVWCELKLTLPRAGCNDLQRLCVKATPSDDGAASYSEDNHREASTCVDISHLRNCMGVAVNGVSFEADTEYASLNQTIRFSIAWAIGTDMIYLINYNDSHTYTWDFVLHNHTEHYYNISTHTEHMFSTSGNMSVVLLVGNEVENLTYSIVIYVEPDLNNVLSFSLDYDPQHTPTPVEFVISHLPPTPLDYITIWCTLDVDHSGEKVHIFAALEETFSVFYYYLGENPSAYPSVSCTNHVSNVTSMSRVILRKPIQGLDIIPWVQYGTTFENATFNITMINGSDATFNVRFGDGFEAMYTHPNVYSDLEGFGITNQYIYDGRFHIQVFAYNEYFNDSTSVIYLVQHRVYNLEITGPSVIRYPPGRGDFFLDFVFPVPAPSNVTCNWTVDTMTLDSIASPELSNGKLYNYTSYYERDQLGTNMTLDVVCYNLVSSQHLHHIYSMHEVIAGLEAYMQPMTLATHQQGRLNISLTNGSDVSFNVFFSDQQMWYQKHPHRLSFRYPLYLNKSYDIQGNFTIAVYAENAVSDYSFIMEEDIVVQNLIIDLILDATNDTIWPPGTLEFNISISERQLPIENIHCNWDFDGIGSMYTYIEALEEGMSHTIVINTTRSHVGLLNTTLVCSNLVSNITIWAITHVILDAVILDSLENRGAIFWTNATQFQLSVERFGTQSCFQWDMGNEEPGFLHGVSLCAPYALENGLNFIEVPFGQMRIEHNYTFPVFGVYTVSVFAFNHVSNDTQGNNAIVMDWLCFPPNITVHNGTESMDSPLRHKKCHTLRLVMATDIYCWKTHSVRTLWELYAASDMETILLSQNDTTHFDYAPRMLPYGVYLFQITARMDNISHTSRVEDSYIEIVKCPLNVSLADGPITQVKVNTSYLLNALDVTFDPDVEPWDKSGLLYSWFCNRTDISNLLQVFAEDQITIFNGCFMDGYDIASHSEGAFLLDANRLLPMAWYHFRVTVSKDTRKEHYDKMIYTNPQESPVIVIGCRENCDSRKRISGRIIFNTSCVKYCTSPYGEVQYEWHMYKVLDEDAVNVSGTIDLNPQQIDLEEVLDLSEHTNGGIHLSSLFVAPFTLTGGYKYIVAATAWTPGSLISTQYTAFLANLPPYNGSCYVTPREGIASVTQFLVNCEHWLTWRAPPNTTLYYDFRIRPPGTPASSAFPIFFGTERMVDPVVFPVGDVTQDLSLEVVAWIIDGIGDFYELVQNVTVYPRPGEVWTIMNEIFRRATDLDPILHQFLANHTFQRAATYTYALLSELNVPLYLYFPHNATYDPLNGTEFNVTLWTYADMETNLRTLKREARSALVETMDAIPLSSVGFMMQVNELMISLLYIPREITLRALYQTSGILEKLVAAFLTYRAQGLVEDPTYVTHALGEAATKTMLAANVFSESLVTHYYLSSDNDGLCIPGSGGANTSTTLDQDIVLDYLTAKQDTVYNHTHADTVKFVMEVVVRMIDVIGETLLEDSLPGDPLHILHYGTVVWVIAKLSGQDVAHFSIEFPNLGAINYPDEVFIDEIPSCVEIKLLFSVMNPYVYGPQSLLDIPVRSSTLQNLMEPCTGNHTFEIHDYEVRLIPEDTGLLFTINATAVDVNAIVYHTYHVAHNTTGLVVLFRPEDYQIFSLYGSMYEYPVPSQYEWTARFMQNQTENLDKGYYLDETFHVAIPADNISAGWLYVGVRREGCLLDPVVYNCTDEYLYQIQLVETACETWIEQDPVWRHGQGQCQGTDVDDKGHVTFKSNLFGSLGAGMFVAPNMIDFGTIFQNVDKKILANLAVFVVVCVLVVLYVPGMVACNKADRLDKIKLSSNSLLPVTGKAAMALDSDIYLHFYDVHVYTGFRSHAQTSSKVRMVIRGTNGCSRVLHLDNGDNKKFRRGGLDVFPMLLVGPLGELTSVRVWHDDSGHKNNASWYLSKIVIVDRHTGKWFLFMCENWLAVDESDGNLERYLPVTSKESQLHSNQLLRHNANRKLSDEHLWFSVVFKRYWSQHTRAQRLSVCLATLFLTMVADAMWYNTEQASSAGIFSFGPITMSVTEIVNSIISSLMVLPPIFLVSYIFTHVTSKQPVQNAPTAMNVKRRTFDNIFEAGYSKVQKTKKCLHLPYWSLYIAWLLVVIYILLSAFFVILYSWSWEPGVSDRWLLAFGLSFFESVLIIQPVKVLLLAVILTFISKTDADLSDYEQRYGKDMQSGAQADDHGVQDINLSNTVCEESRKERVLEGKMKKMLREVLGHALYLTLLLVISYGNLDKDHYLQTWNIRSTVSYEEKVTYTGNFLSWLHVYGIPALYNEVLYSGDVSTNYDRAFIDSANHYRLGNPSLRQLRVTQEPCNDVANLVSSYSYRCTAWYEDSLVDVLDYSPHWINDTDQVIIPGSRLHDAFRYRSANDLKSVPYWGTLGVYEGGGYVADLGGSISSATQLSEQLHLANWMDQYTRAVFVDFNVYNANSNLFSLLTLSFEFPPSGGALFRKSVSTVSLYRYYAALGVVALTAEVLCLVVVIVTIGHVAVNMMEQKWKFFLLTTNWADCFTILFYFIAVTFYVYRSVWTVKSVEDMMNHKGSPANFQKVAFSNDVYLCFLGCIVFIEILQFLHILRYNKNIMALVATLGRGRAQIFSMTVITLIMVLSFGALGQGLFGHFTQYYSTLPASLGTLTSALLGGFDFSVVEEVAGVWGRVYLLAYLLTMIILIMDIYVSLINEFLAETTVDPDSLGKESEVFDFFMDSIRNLFKGKQYPVQANTNALEKDMLLSDAYDSNFKNFVQLILEVKGELENYQLQEEDARLD